MAVSCLSLFFLALYLFPIWPHSLYSRDFPVSWMKNISFNIWDSRQFFERMSYCVQRWHKKIMTHKNNTWKFPGSHRIVHIIAISVKNPGERFCQCEDKAKIVTNTTYFSYGIFLVCPLLWQEIISALSASQWVSVVVNRIKSPRKPR